MIRVLFVHGLESQPNGSKTRMLRAQGFDVVAPDLHMGLFQFRRRNSAVRQLFRLTETRIALLLAGAGASVLATGWVLVRRKALFAKALGRSFDTSVEIVRDAIKDAHPDVVVGSSWGGAVVAELVADGVWSGPTVLLAPAIHKVRAWTRRDNGADIAGRLREKSKEVPIVVFHDPSDDTVPFQDSVELARGSKIDLRSVNAGGHRLLELLERGELATTIQDMVG